jgi:hypothetical protein
MLWNGKQFLISFHASIKNIKAFFLIDLIFYLLQFKFQGIKLQMSTIYIFKTLKEFMQIKWLKKMDIFKILQSFSLFFWKFNFNKNFSIQIMGLIFQIFSLKFFYNAMYSGNYLGWTKFIQFKNFSRKIHHDLLSL